MHFLPCFDVIVLSMHGRFQIKLWKVLAFKLVISGDYLAAVELTFFILFSGPQTGLCDCALQRQYQMLIVDMLQQWTPTAADQIGADWIWRGNSVKDFTSFTTLCLGVRNENKIKRIHQMQNKEIVEYYIWILLCSAGSMFLGFLILVLDWADLK